MLWAPGIGGGLLAINDDVIKAVIDAIMPRSLAPPKTMIGGII